MAGADEHRSTVGSRVVDATRNRQRVGLGAEIVIVDRDRIPIPFLTRVFEATHQLLLLGIHTDDGQALIGEALALPADIQELRIAVGAFAVRNLLAVDTESVLHLFEQTADGVLADLDSQRGELFGDLARRAPAPFHSGDGVSSRVVAALLFVEHAEKQHQRRLQFVAYGFPSGQTAGQSGFVLTNAPGQQLSLAQSPIDRTVQIQSADRSRAIRRC